MTVFSDYYIEAVVWQMYYGDQKSLQKYSDSNFWLKLMIIKVRKTQER